LLKFIADLIKYELISQKVTVKISWKKRNGKNILLESKVHNLFIKYVYFIETHHHLISLIISSGVNDTLMIAKSRTINTV